MKTTIFKLIVYRILLILKFIAYPKSKMLSIDKTFNSVTFWFYGPSDHDDRSAVWVSTTHSFNEPRITLYVETREPGTDMTPTSFSTDILRRLNTYIRIFTRK